MDQPSDQVISSSDCASSSDPSVDGSDSDLLQRWQQGDERCGQTLLRRYGPRLLRFFASKGLSSPEDLTQLTLLACYQSHTRVRNHSSFAGFIYAIARNVLLHHFRGQKRKSCVELRASSVHDLGPSLSQWQQRRQEDRIMLEALRRLSIDDQIIVELYYWEELSGREIAEILAIPEGTLRTRLMSVKKRLHRSIELLTSEGAAHLRTTKTRLDDWAKALAQRPLGAV